MIAEATALSVVLSSPRLVGMLWVINLDQQLLFLMPETSNPSGRRVKARGS